MTRAISSPIRDRPMTDGVGVPDTFPKLLIEHARARATHDRPTASLASYAEPAQSFRPQCLPMW